jgi:hypothetical protein
VCDFHSIVVRADGAKAHVFGNSHSEAVEAAGWLENEPHKRKRFVECEWDGKGEYPGAEQITRLEVGDELTAKQRETIDRHYKFLAAVMSGDEKPLHTVFLEPQWRDVWLESWRNKVPDTVWFLARRLAKEQPDPRGLVDALFAVKDRNLELVWPRFAYWLMLDEKHGVLRFAKTERARKAITRVGELYGTWAQTGTKPPIEDFRAAAAYAAAAYAYDAASAAAAYAASAYAAAAAAAYAARVAQWAAMTDKLISLLSDAPK